jgi:hypothetical protein
MKFLFLLSPPSIHDDFRCEYDVLVLPKCGAASLGDWWPIFRDTVLVTHLTLKMRPPCCIGNVTQWHSAISDRNEGISPLEPNGHYSGRTAQLISRICVLNIYSTNILTEYFKHAARSPFFFPLSSRRRLFHNSTCFGSCNIHI